MSSTHQESVGGFRAPEQRRSGLLSRAFRQVRGAIQHLFSAPFARDPELATLPLDQRERLRRGALLRLIISCLLTMQLVVGIPVAIVSGSPPLDLALQCAIVVFGAICLALNAAGRTTLAAALYIYPPMAAMVSVILQNPGGLDFRALLFYNTPVVFILVTGLLLPSSFIWLTLALALGVDVWGVSTLAVAPAIATMATGEPVRPLVGAILAVSYILTAILTHVFARSARAGIDAVGRAFERERELTQLKDQFIIDANHELRTPIMALYNNLELLSATLEQGDPARRARLMQRALTAGDAVLRLLRNVLDTGALESNAPRIEPVALLLAPTVRAVLETFDPQEIGEPSLAEGMFQSRTVTVSVPPDLGVWADEARLRQALINLISNALKYSDPGTPIEVAAYAVRKAHGQESSLIQLNVRDHGLGIPHRDQPKLFQRFVRLERDIAGPVRGTGVGLYVCRILVMAMGGRIWVESSGVPGEGSTFCFTLPAASTALPELPTELADSDSVAVDSVPERSLQGNSRVEHT
ncbi:MAG TPA: HAMP domain-containing sensor histidine kinase [Ktedonobacterales bacterium]|nr:HAMP domain-containing sensor histidine kinase [Ktedonobacterales bacterium]